MKQVEQASVAGHLLRQWWPCAVVLLLGIAVRWPLLNLEFGRNGDGTGSMYGIAARNYLLRSNWETWWMPVISVGGATLEPTVYAHHPPTVPLLMAVSVAVFGDHDWVMRLPALLFTLGSGAVVYGLLRRLGGWGGDWLSGVVGAAVMLFVPLSLRFGQMPDVVNSQLVFFVGLAIWMYVRVLEKKTPGRMLAWVLAMVGGMLTDWPAFFLVPVLGAHLVLWRPVGWKSLLVTVVVLSVAVFGALYVWVSLATGNWGLIPDHFLKRSAKAELDNAEPFTWGSWAAGMWRYNVELHTVPLLVTALVGGIWGLWRGRKTVAVAAAVVACWGVMHVVVGRQAGLNHQWWLWPMTLTLAVEAGVLVLMLGRVSSGPLRNAVVGVVTVGLCTWWTVTEVRHSLSREWLDSGCPQYSMVDLRNFVQAHVPEGEAVVLYEDDMQPYLVYNMNRPVIQRVYDPQELERRIREGRGDLFYNFDQKLERPPVAFVIPKAYLEKGADMVEWLSKRYSRVEGEKLVLFKM